MAYQINKTDGTIVATVADGQIDDLSTDLTLIGKNFSGFGEAFNENLVKLLENFSNTTSPLNPIKGQLWFDASESKLKIYKTEDCIRFIQLIKHSSLNSESVRLMDFYNKSIKPQIQCCPPL